MSGALDAVRARYLAVHGHHPMTDDDVRLVRELHEPVDDPAVLQAMADGLVPLPSYLLPDGTPVAPACLAETVGHAGGVERLHDWFVAHWPPDEAEPAEAEWADHLTGRQLLRAPTPTSLRARSRLASQAEAALRQLGREPGDPVARGSLSEAVDGLDRLLLPGTEHDALRFGRPTVRERLVEAPRRDHLTPVDPALPIRTERLLIRRRRPEDTADLFGLYGRPDVARYLLGDADAAPTLLEMEGRLRARAAESGDDVGAVVELEGRVVGELVLIRRGATQAETGWALHPDVGGRGIATEAARALIDAGFRELGLHRVYAELDARNTASARLCERLGMRLESHRRADYWSKGEWTDTLQYAVLATEWSCGRSAVG